MQGTAIEHGGIYQQFIMLELFGRSLCTRDLSLKRDQKCDAKLFHNFHKLNFHECKRSLKGCLLEIGSLVGKLQSTIVNHI